MKHFQLNDLLNWKPINIPQAFPGKYPTRIAYLVDFRDGAQVNYIGKPNLISVKKYLRARQQLDITRWYEWEFDRGNILTFRASRRGLDATHSTLAKLYHPFRTVDGIGAFAQPFWRKRISGFTCYSPFETLKLPMVKAHKTWLVASGIAKGKELSKAFTPAGFWQCVCGHFNRAGWMCANCGAQPSPSDAERSEEAYWDCLQCQRVNYEWRIACPRCGTARPNGLS